MGWEAKLSWMSTGHSLTDWSTVIEACYMDLGKSALANKLVRSVPILHLDHKYNFHFAHYLVHTSRAYGKTNAVQWSREHNCPFQSHI